MFWVKGLCFGVTEFWLSHLLALWHAGQSTILHLSFGLFICNIRIFLVPASSGDYFMETVYLNFRQIGGTLECVILEERKNEPSRGTWPGPEGQGRLPRRSGNWLWDLRPGQKLTINEKEVVVHFVWFTKIWLNKIVIRGWTGKESQNPLLTPVSVARRKGRGREGSLRATGPEAHRESEVEGMPKVSEKGHRDQRAMWPTETREPTRQMAQAPESMMRSWSWVLENRGDHRKALRRERSGQTCVFRTVGYLSCGHGSGWRQSGSRRPAKKLLSYSWQEMAVGIPIVAQQKQIRGESVRIRVQSLPSLSGSGVQRCLELRCRSQMWLRFQVAVAVV